MTETIGSKLSELRRRSGMSLAEVARAAGYSGPSSVQTYFDPAYDKRPLGGHIAMRLAKGLLGKGDPPIEIEDISALTQFDASQIRAAFEARPDFAARLEPNTEVFEAPTLRGQPKDVQVFGSALAADLPFDTDGNGPRTVEITNFAMGDVIAYVRRPPAIVDSQKVYAVFVSGSSMEPRYRPGDPVFVDPKRPPSIGDDVIVQLVSDDESEDIVTGLIKTLVRRTSGYLELEQYSPAVRFQVPAERIAHIHRVIPWREAFGI